MASETSELVLDRITLGISSFSWLRRRGDRISSSAVLTLGREQNPANGCAEFSEAMLIPLADAVSTPSPTLTLPIQGPARAREFSSPLAACQHPPRTKL